MIIGKTIDGKRVLGGIFKLTDTYGLPLDLILEVLSKKDFLISWKHFYEDAKKAGWRKDSIIKKIKSDITDSALKEKIIKYYNSMKTDDRDMKIKGAIF